MIRPISFQVVEIVGSLIQNKVEDIDKERDGDRWVFPSFAKKTSNLPQATIDLGDPSYENDSAGNFLYSETLDNGDHKEYYYKKVTYPAHIFVLSQKEKEITVNDSGGSLFLTGKPLNAYITALIKEGLWKYRGDLLVYFDDFKLISVSPVFEDDEYTWSSDMSYEVKAKDMWVREYHKGELIADYSLNTNVI